MYINIFYGFIIGTSMLIPGISGGSIAVYLGIYNKIIDSLANFSKNIKKNSIFLIYLLIGASISGIIFSKIFSLIMDKFEFPIRIVLGTVFILISCNEIIKAKYIIKVKGIISTIIGVSSPFMLFFFSNFNIDINNEFQLFLISIPLSLALILPGISFTYCLVILNIYKDILKAITNFEFSLILILSLGICIGIILFTKIINTIINEQSYIYKSCLSGFVLASSIQIIPINYLLNNNISYIFIIFGTIIFYIIKSFIKK